MKSHKQVFCNLAVSGSVLTRMVYSVSVDGVKSQLEALLLCVHTSIPLNYYCDTSKLKSHGHSHTHVPS
jgi:hypothetical protein